jgi:hypothetical protein
MKDKGRNCTLPELRGDLHLRIWHISARSRRLYQGKGEGSELIAVMVM